MGFMHAAWSPWAQWALATLVVLVFGRRFLSSAWRQLRHGGASMDTRVALGTGMAYAFAGSGSSAGGAATAGIPSLQRARGREPSSLPPKTSTMVVALSRFTTTKLVT